MLYKILEVGGRLAHGVLGVVQLVLALLLLSLVARGLHESQVFRWLAGLDWWKWLVVSLTG